MNSRDRGEQADLRRIEDDMSAETSPVLSSVLTELRRCGLSPLEIAKA